MYNCNYNLCDIKVDIMEEVTVQELAYWFLNRESMTHKKLQKICYYAVAWGWALMGKSLITDDRFEAWVHGPVAPKLYDAYKKYGWNDIPSVGVEAVPDISGSLIDLLESVWLTYGEKSGNELEALSHAERPWVEARGSLPSDKNSNQPIKPAVMQKFYNSIKSTDF